MYNVNHTEPSFYLYSTNLKWNIHDDWTHQDKGEAMIAHLWNIDMNHLIVTKSKTKSNYGAN